MDLSEESPVLSSWKDIARYVGKGVRTVQRWEHHFGLPVRRPNGALHKSAVLLERRDLDAWLATRFSSRGAVIDLAAKGSETQDNVRITLREGIRTARELRNANHLLTQQIRELTRQLTQQCQPTSNPALELAWSRPDSIDQKRPSRLQPKRIGRVV